MQCAWVPLILSLGGITGGILQIVPYLVSVTISPDTFGAPYVTGIPWYHSWYPVDSALAPPPPPLTPVDNLLCTLCSSVSFSLFGQVIRLPPYFFTLDMCRFQEITTQYDVNGDIYPLEHLEQGFIALLEALLSALVSCSVGRSVVVSD